MEKIDYENISRQQAIRARGDNKPLKTRINASLAIREISAQKSRLTADAVVEDIKDSKQSEFDYKNIPNYKAYVDQQTKIISKLLMDAMKASSPAKTMLARLNLFKLNIPGWWGKRFENFKLDIAPFLFDSNGKLRTEPDMEAVSELVGKFFRVISYHKEHTRTYARKAEKRGLTSLKNYIHVHGIFKEFNLMYYGTERRDFWRNFEFGYDNMLNKITDNTFNKMFEFLINRFKNGQFRLAGLCISSLKDEQDKETLIAIYKYFHNLVHNQYGVFRNLTNDPFYKKLSVEELKRVGKNQQLQNKVNRDLSIRYAIKQKIETDYKIEKKDRPTEVDWILYRLVDFTINGDDHPLEKLGCDPVYSKFVDYFFQKNDTVKSFQEFITYYDNILNPSEIDDFFKEHWDLKIVLYRIKLWLPLIKDKGIAMKIFHYLKNSLKAEKSIAFLYQSIGSHMGLLLMNRQQESLLTNLGNIIFIDNHITPEQTENHKKILYIVRECLKGLKDIKSDTVQFDLISAVFARINDLFNLNKDVECQFQVERDLLQLFEILGVSDPALITELIDSVQNNTFALFDFLFKKHAIDDLKNIIQKLK